MEKKTASAIMLTLLLTSMLTLSFNIQLVKASGTIYIRADGSIDPPTAPISSADNVTYTLTDNIVGDVPENSSAIIIERDNILVDGAGYTVQGIGSGTGIDLSQRSNVTVKNARIYYFDYGIYVWGMGAIVIEENEISNNSESGIIIAGESNVLIRENTIKQNKNGIDTDTANTHSGIMITGNAILSNQQDGVYIYSYAYTYSEAYSYIHNITISSNTVLFNGGNGLYLYSYGYAYHPYDWCYGYSYLYDVTISNNTISSNDKNGLQLYSCATGSSYIYDVRTSFNNVSFNGENGMYLYSYGYKGYEIEGYYYGYGYIYDVIMSFNSVSSNSGKGIYIYSYGDKGFSGEYPGAYGCGYIYELVVLSNIVSLNGDSGIHLYSQGRGYQPYDYHNGQGCIYTIMFSSNNVSANNGNGIHLHSYGSNGYDDGRGFIYNVTTSFNIISSNTLSGIYFMASNHFLELVYDLAMVENIISANHQKGIWIDGGINANLTHNSISHNGYGIYLSQSCNSTIFHNNFVGNTIQAYAQNSISIWDDDYPSGGNYWSDYSGVDVKNGPAQDLSGSDGIGDTPYVIDAENVDHYPLMSPSYLSITVATDKLTYTPAENVQIYGNLTLGEMLVADALVGVQVQTSGDELLTIRTVNTGSNPSTMPHVKIQSVVPCDLSGDPKEIFEAGTLAYFKITVTNYDIDERTTRLTVSTYYSDDVPFGRSSIGFTLSGQTTTMVILSIPIPTEAVPGTATVYANAYTDWPKLRGTPYCSEVNATFQITETTLETAALQVWSLDNNPITENGGNYALNFKLPPEADLGTYTVYVSSSYEEQQATDKKTFIVNPPPPQTYSLTIITTVGGTTDPAPGTYSYTANSSVQVTAIPNADYTFDHWELDTVNVGSANPYTVLMDNNHTLKAVFIYSPPPPSLSASISPLSASILVGQSVTFTSTVSGGYTPYSYQWYLNGAPVSGATSNTWAFTPTTSGIYYIHLKVTDAKGNTAQSDTARIAVAAVPVGGYSIPIQVQTKAEPVLPYIALIATLTAIFTKLRPKTKRKR